MSPASLRTRPGSCWELRSFYLSPVFLLLFSSQDNDQVFSPPAPSFPNRGPKPDDAFPRGLSAINANSTTTSLELSSQHQFPQTHAFTRNIVNSPFRLQFPSPFFPPMATFRGRSYYLDSARVSLRLGLARAAS